MTVYVDCARRPYRGMFMNHMWADTLPELLAMADAIGVKRRYLQKPPRASWVHFDICMKKRALALKSGATPVSTREAVNHRRSHVNSRHSHDHKSRPGFL